MEILFFKVYYLKLSVILKNFTLYNILIIHGIPGRRKAQVRLVEPKGISLNHGDSYVLVTPTQVFCWHGEFSNVIERVKVWITFWTYI